MTSSLNLLRDATVTNSKICSLSEFLAYYAEFSKERQNNGWDFVQNGTLYGVSSGFFFLTSTGKNPSLSRSSVFTAVDAGKFTEVVVKYCYKRNKTYSIADEGSIQFTTVSDLIFDDSKSEKFTVIPDGEWHTYTISFAQHQKWLGLINNLKISFSTNGEKGDEIFISFIKIANSQYNFCIGSCEEYLSEVAFSDYFDTYSINEVPSSYIINNTSLQKFANIQVDPLNTNNSVLKIVNNDQNSVGPIIYRNSYSAAGTGYCSIKFLITNYAFKFSLLHDSGGMQEVCVIRIDNVGHIQYKNSSGYEILETAGNIALNTWHNLLLVFDATGGNYSIYLNGTAVELNLPTLNNLTVSSIRIEQDNLVESVLYIDEILMVSNKSRLSDCPGIGKQGVCISRDNYFNKLDIETNVNDSILIDINNYGLQLVRIPSGRGLSLEDLRKGLQQSIGKLNIGGYANAEVLIVDNKFIIKSGSFGFDSSVRVEKYQMNGLAELLGFYDNDNFIGLTSDGYPHVAGFKFLNNIRLDSTKLLSLQKQDRIDPVLVRRGEPETSIGSYLSQSIGRKYYISGVGKTLVDFSHPATSEGFIEEIIFNGIVRPGTGNKLTGSTGIANGNIFQIPSVNLNSQYIGIGDILVIQDETYSLNGEYGIFDVSGDKIVLDQNINLPYSINIGFSIINGGKIKLFRPSSGGKLTLVSEIPLGISHTSPLLSRVVDFHKVYPNWYVQKGDMVGVYNAFRVNMGNVSYSKGSDGFGETGNASFLQYDGDIQDTEYDVKNLQGCGIGGIGLFGYSTSLKGMLSIDIDFGIVKSIKDVVIAASTDSEGVDYNLCTSINSGLNLEVTVTGRHTHLYLDYYQGGIYASTEHNNVAYNLQALTDGEKFASNGVLGSFEQTVTGATYFYVNGDGEFSSQLEYPVGSNREDVIITGYTLDPIDFNFILSADKDVAGFKINFKEYPNSDGHYLEWLNNGVYEKIGEGHSSVFSFVGLNDLIIFKGLNQYGDLFFQDQFRGGANEVISGMRGNGATYFANFPYTNLTYSFTPVTTHAFHFRIFNHRSTKITEMELLSRFYSEESLDGIFEVYFSEDGNLFQRGEIGLIDDEVVAKINFPVRYMRIMAHPYNTVWIKDIQVNGLDNQTRYIETDTEAPVEVIDLPFEIGSYSEVKKVSIVNETGTSADVDIYLDVDELSSDIILKSSLSSVEDIMKPEIGTEGVVDFSEDFNLSVQNNVAINSKTFGLRNLAPGKRYYESIVYETESDFFQGSIEPTKWIRTFSGLPSCGYYQDFPGLEFKPINPSYKEPLSNFNGELQSDWIVGGSFSAYIMSSYDATLTRSTFGTSIGIVDSVGNKLFINKSRKLGQEGGSYSYKYDYAGYGIYFNNTRLSYKLSFSVSIGGDYNLPGASNGIVFGTSDDNVPYTLFVQRELDSVLHTDKMKFSYRDTTNGTGQNREWDGEECFEVDLVPYNLQGPLKVFIGGWGSLSNTYSYGHGGSSPNGAYVKISQFSFCGESSYSPNRQISFSTVPRDIGISGYIHVNNSTNGYAIKSVAVDLTRNWALETIQNFTSNPTITGLWSVFSTSFSNSETSDPNKVNWGNASQFGARWILFEEAASSIEGLKYLENLRIYPDITRLPAGFLTNSLWDDLGNILTDNDPSTTVVQNDYPVICTRLADNFNTKNFSLVNKSNLEFKVKTNAFDGWTYYSPSSRGYYNTSLQDGDEPTRVKWDGTWQEYTPDSIKVPGLYKWFAFKNNAFDITSQSIKLYAAKLNVLSNDLIDCTEFHEWFTLPKRETINIGTMSLEEQYDSDLLCSGSLLRDEGRSNSWGNAFDGSTESYIGLSSSPIPLFLDRYFGEVETTNSSGSLVTVSGDGDVFVLPVTDNLNRVLSGSIQKIDSVSISIPDTSPSIPDSIDIQKLSISGWSTIYSEKDLAVQVYENSDSSAYQYIFNNGNPLAIYFSSPVETSGIRISITGVKHNNPSQMVVYINNLDICSSLTGTSEAACQLDNDYDVKKEGAKSLRVTIPKNIDTPINIFTGEAVEFKPDILWHQSDYFSFWFKSSVTEDIQWDQSFISLGKSATDCYKWHLGMLESQLGNDEMSLIKLRFEDAYYKANGSLDDGTFGDVRDLRSKISFINGPLNYLSITLVPRRKITETITFWIDKFQFIKDKIVVKEGDSFCFLNNRESIKYELTEIDPHKGFMSMVIMPYWGGVREGTQYLPEIYSLFSIQSKNEETLSVFYSTMGGLEAFINASSGKINYRCGIIEEIVKNKPFTLSVYWNTLDSAEGAFEFYINNKLVNSFEGKWEFKEQSNCHFYLGGMLDQLSAVAGTESLGDNDIVSSMYKPEVFSINGGIRNLLISKSKINLLYNDLDTLKDNIFISFDGINFISGSDILLPYKINNVLDNQKIDIWIKSFLPEDTINIAREGFLRTRWVLK